MELQPTGMKMMRGSGGAMDYLMVGLVDGVALGLKPNTIAVARIEKHTYVGARVRSAMADESAPKDHTVLGKHWLTDGFDTKSSSRYSGQMGTIIPFDLAKDPKGVYEALTDGSLATRMAKTVLAMVPVENQLIKQEVLAEWIISRWDPAISKLVEQINKQEKFDAEMSETAGTFTMQAEMLKKMFGGNSQSDLMPDDKGHYPMTEKGKTSSSTGSKPKSSGSKSSSPKASKPKDDYDGDDIPDDDEDQDDEDDDDMDDDEDA